ncbi:MAG: phage integrase SAM-like domain-containing protein, partial [Cytophagaceae bacterium]|nr:phage integrase SAM-like domain-containing protein [Cytophagaceae bacterium]
MNSNTFGIIFYLRKYKAKDNKAPIYARITVNGLRAEFSMKRDIEMSSWNSSKGMAKPSKEEFKSLNNYLEQIRARLVECYQTLQLERKLITAEAIKNKFLGNEEKQHSLISLFNYHNITLKDTLEWGTMKNYGTTQKYVELFLKEEKKTSDIFLSQLNYKFIKDFELFLKSHKPKDHQKPCGQNTAMKHIERFRKIMNMAVK